MIVNIINSSINNKINYNHIDIIGIGNSTDKLTLKGRIRNTGRTVGGNGEEEIPVQANNTYLHTTVKRIKDTKTFEPPSYQ